MNIQKVLLSCVVISALCLSACGKDKKSPPVIHTPTAMDSSVTTQADTAVTGNFMANVDGGGALTYVIATQPTQGTVQVNTNGSFTYTPNVNTTGMDQFTFTAVTSDARSLPATVKIVIGQLDVSFDDYSRKAYNQSATAEPLPLNTRNVKQNVTDPTAYDDLLK